VPKPIYLSALPDAITEVTGLSAESAGEPSREPEYADPDIDPEEASSMLYIMGDIVRD